jgi:hypothetical protein
LAYELREPHHAGTRESVDISRIVNDEHFSSIKEKSPYIFFHSIRKSNILPDAISDFETFVKLFGWKETFASLHAQFDSFSFVPYFDVIISRCLNDNNVEYITNVAKNINTSSIDILLKLIPMVAGRFINTSNEKAITNLVSISKDQDDMTKLLIITVVGKALANRRHYHSQSDDDSMNIKKIVENLTIDGELKHILLRIEENKNYLYDFIERYMSLNHIDNKKITKLLQKERNDHGM